MDLALLLEQLELADGLGDRNLRIDAMQLEQLDPLEVEMPQ